MMVSMIGMNLASGPYISTRGQVAQAGCRLIAFVDVMPTCMNCVNCGSCEALQGYSNIHSRRDNDPKAMATEIIDDEM